ncbi:Endochitinase [Nymphaea thermarum]|nr:Endochitinase [Nymphaea thermarum]
MVMMAVALLLELGSAQGPPPPRTIRTIVTPWFYNRLLAAVPGRCSGKRLYTYNAFILAAESFAGFGTTGTNVTRKREMAAFLANVMHETGSLCYTREIRPQSRYCSPSAMQYRCVPGESYYGRGPLQLTWNYNYGAAGRYLSLNLLRNPDLVAQNGIVSFKTAVWFWMVNSRCHSGITTGRGFGSTIRAINGGECGGGRPNAVKSRVEFYLRFCREFGVTPGPNIYC